MNDTRRERYEAALCEADGRDPAVCAVEYKDAADAAMAVADVEQRSLRAEVDGLDEALRGLISASEKDNNRLRAEKKARTEWAEAAEKENARLRAELDGVHKALAEERDVAVRTEAENARLRADLEAALMAPAIWSNAQKQVAHAHIAAEATLSRVRAELDEARKECEIHARRGVRDARELDQQAVTISRVRAVVDDMGEDESASAIVYYIRTALDPTND